MEWSVRLFLYGGAVLILAGFVDMMRTKTPPISKRERKKLRKKRR